MLVVGASIGPLTLEVQNQREDSCQIERWLDWVCSISEAEKMVPHTDGARRNDESPVRRSQRVARYQPREDAGEEEGVGKEHMNSEQGTHSRFER